MKAVRDRAAFVPVVLTIESQAELDLLTALVGSTTMNVEEAVTGRRDGVLVRMCSVLNVFYNSPGTLCKNISVTLKGTK